jgi:hypothetical protein
VDLRDVRPGAALVSRLPRADMLHAVGVGAKMPVDRLAGWPVDRLAREHAEGVKHTSPRQRLGIGVRRPPALQGRSIERAMRLNWWFLEGGRAAPPMQGGVDLRDVRPGAARFSLAPG